MVQESSLTAGKKRKVPEALSMLDLEALKFGRVELHGGAVLQCRSADAADLSRVSGQAVQRILLLPLLLIGVATYRSWSQSTPSLVLPAVRRAPADSMTR